MAIAMKWSDGVLKTFPEKHVVAYRFSNTPSQSSQAEPIPLEREIAAWERALTSIKY